VPEQSSNPLQSDDPRDWERLIESLGPAALLVAIEGRLSAELAARVSAEDLLQEALLHLWRDRERIEWRGPRAFRALVLSMADNRIRDAADHEFALKRGGLPAAGEGSQSASHAPRSMVGSTTPSRVAMAREQADAMRRALESLPDDVREVVRLRLIEELATQEVADRLGLGLSATKHRFLRGAKLYRDRLRDELGSKGASTSSP
jgi:RNA polymerase sigma-70 factor (ECF subfamily)